MRNGLRLILVTALVAGSGIFATSSNRAAAQGAAIASIGPLTFAPDGTLFAADTAGAAIFAFDPGTHAAGTAGAANVDALDQKLAAALGGSVSDIRITDLAVHPRSRNAFVSVMRQQGAKPSPALFRIDGAAAITAVPLQTLKSSSVPLPNIPASGRGGFQEMQRQESITDMAFMAGAAPGQGTLWVAGLSNEEFSSKLRGIACPFKTADRGTSVEIYHGSHGAWETEAPIYAFVPHTILGQPYFIASYLCTPLVTFPVSSLKPGAKVRGTTVAELGNMNRPLDMILYTKGGAEYLLMSNNARGVMKMPTTSFTNAPPIERMVPDTAGVKYETIASLGGVTELDRLDVDRAVVIARGTAGMDLRILPLP
jgi:hypothetical protein